MARKEKSSYHHPDLAAALARKAAEIIARQGVSGLTMRALGEQLGVSRAAAYRHFTDKNAVLVAVATNGFERLTAQIRGLSESSGAPRVGLLREIGMSYIQFALDNQAHYRLMYGKEALSRIERPELRVAANSLFDLIVEIIVACQRKGILRNGNPKLLAYSAWSSLHGLASLLIEGQILGQVERQTLIKHTVETLLRGIRP